MNDFQKRALQYVRNTSGGTTKEIFMEDHEPIGARLWEEIKQYVRTDERGRLYLTDEGNKVLEES